MHNILIKGKEELEMQKIWNWFCSVVYNYGMYGAGQHSYHGSYEANVPEMLQQSAKR